MQKLSRRNFLKLSAAGAGAAALASCLPSQPSAEPIFSPDPSSTAFTSDAQSATQSPTFIPEPSADLPDLAVAHVGEPEDLVRRAVNGMGGMQRFIPSGSRVIIKPNICVGYRSYEYAATTNPWVVGALVKLAFEAGAGSVGVLDFPFASTAADAYRMSGIQEQVESAGGEMVPVKKVRFIDIELPGAVALKRAAVYDEILNAQVLINAPIAKQHGSAGLTLSMKNLMGTIWDRPAIHWDFGNNLTDLNARIPSTLVVIDAVRILTYGGPQGGDLDAVVQKDTVIASTDVVAADAWTARNLFGWDPFDLSYISTGSQRGLGRADLENIKIKDV